MIGLLLPIIYIAFISLGLPDALLGSVWPIMRIDLNAPLSYAGIIFGVISSGTIVSSLASDFLTEKLGAGKVTALSVALTALALLGFSISDEYWQLLIMAIPYGLGAGSVDACLNNYVALHYESRHMSWLHCMWGIGASVGPYIMSLCLTNGFTWNAGYRTIGLLQVILSALLLLSLPLWKTKVGVTEKTKEERKTLNPIEVLSISGAKQVMILFFCYCALEQTTGLWASSYLVMVKGITEELATQFASLFFVGITCGRFVSGFLTMKFNDDQMIRIGQLIIALGIIMMLFPFGNTISLVGFILIGLGCAPIYPCIIHSTPARFGAEKSQSVVGIQMASAYVGTLCMPPLFGVLANQISVALLPMFLMLILVMMTTMHQWLCGKEKENEKSL